MKAEQFLLDYILKSNIPIERVRNDIGIDMQALVNNHNELMADEFIRLCIYLGINPDDMIDEVV